MTYKNISRPQYQDFWQMASKKLPKDIREKVRQNAIKQNTKRERKQ